MLPRVLSLSIVSLACLAPLSCATSVTDDLSLDDDGGAAADAARAGGDAGSARDSSSGIDAAESPDTSSPPDDAAVPDTSVADASHAPDTSVGGATKPSQGELLITEVMFNPTTTEPDTEWFEVTNTASSPRLLSGLSLADGSGHTDAIPASPSIAVAPGAYVILARNRAAAVGAKVPAASIVYEYATLTLANGSTGAVAILDGATTIAQSPYGGFSLASASVTGSSIQLTSLTYAAESAKGSWCISTLAWSAGADHGTPGAAQKCQ